MIKWLNVNVTIITKENGLLKDLDIKKYNKQYHNLNIKYSNVFHDRYFILDNNKIYHCGTSVNNAGSKTFSINLLEDKEICDILNNKVNKIIK